MKVYNASCNDKLTSLLRAGDERAYDEIFRQFYQPLCFFAERILADSFHVEDIVQNTLIKLWQGKHDFNSSASLRAFLYVSVRNACFNELEKGKVRSKYQDNLTGVDNDGNALDVMMQAEVVRKLFYAVDSLPEQCRKVIMLTFSDGRSPKEIAAELGISTSTVNNQKMRGIMLLRKRLSDEDLLLALTILFPGIILY